MVSLEDHHLSVVPFKNPTCTVNNILILRDPYNLFSSRIRRASLVNHPAYPRERGEAMNRVVSLWKEHAREYLGITNILRNKICIYFNTWFSDKTYRREISNSLGLKFSDQGYSDVSKKGGGSSFDRTKYDGKSHMMDVLNRKGLLTDDELEFLELITDDNEIQELACMIESHKVKSEDCNGGCCCDV